jgi:hypothetical protein
LHKLKKAKCQSTDGPPTKQRAFGSIISLIPFQIQSPYLFSAHVYALIVGDIKTSPAESEYIHLLPDRRHRHSIENTSSQKAYTQFQCRPNLTRILFHSCPFFSVNKCHKSSYNTHYFFFPRTPKKKRAYNHRFQQTRSV